jgi:hypothetical protein
VQAELIAGAQGIKLPKEFIAAASGAGLRSGALHQYMKLQASSHLSVQHTRADVVGLLV